MQGLKKNQRSALGRGLSALVSSAPVAVTPPAVQVVENTAENVSPAPATEPNSGVLYVDVARITANPEQPRVDFPEQEIVPQNPKTPA